MEQTDQVKNAKKKRFAGGNLIIKESHAEPSVEHNKIEGGAPSQLNIQNPISSHQTNSSFHSISTLKRKVKSFW